MCPLHLGCQNKGRHPQDCQRARPRKWHSIDSGTGSVGNIHVCLWLSWVFPFIRWWAFDAFAHCWLLVKLSKLSSFYGLYNGTHGKYQDCYGVKFLGLNPWRELYPTKRQKILFVAPLGFYLFIHSKKKKRRKVITFQGTIIHEPSLGTISQVPSLMALQGNYANLQTPRWTLLFLVVMMSKMLPYREARDQSPESHYHK